MRFDFSGSGESEGLFSDMTFTGELKEAHAMLDFTLKLDWADNHGIGVLGFSMGGAIAAQMTKNRSEQVGKLCLLSPAGNMREKARLYFSECVRLENGNVDLDGLELGRDFLEDLEALNLYEDLESFNNPVLILHGTEDEAVPVYFGKKYCDYYTKAAFHEIVGANHTFSKLEWRNELVDHLVEFFKGRP